jgi:putative transposase
VPAQGESSLLKHGQAALARATRNASLLVRSTGNRILPVPPCLPGVEAVLLPDGTVRKRRTNFNDPGHAHELTCSCFRKWPLLSKDRTRQWLVEALDAARRRWDFELWAYVVMPDHAHVLLCPRTAEYDIAGIRKSIKQSVARRAIQFLKSEAPEWLERLAVVEGGKRSYRFWQAGGGYDRNIQNAKVAWSAVHYLHANPVRREMAATPVDWRWSSARWYAGLDDVVLAMDDCPPDR